GLANMFNGVTLNSANSNTIGGTSLNARNLISSNSSYGVQILAGATGNSVQGNYIGTDSNRRQALGNKFSGIRIESDGNTIGGPDAAGNLISGNLASGIAVVGSAAQNNTIQGNFIGTSLFGTNALPNGAGIGITDGSGNLIGGMSVGSGNLISGNSGAGIYIMG